MSYQIEFDRKPRYVEAKISGINSPESVAAYLRDIYTKCREWECDRVLIVEHLEGPRLAVDEIFTIASAGAMEALGFFRAVGFVDEKMGDMAYFAETVAVNRGMPVRAFDNLTDARAWLEQLPADDIDKGMFNDGDG